MHKTLPTGKKRIFAALWLCLAAILLSGVSCKHTSDSRPLPPSRKAVEKTNPIVDLMLIYDGGLGHDPWTVDRFRPYVCRENNGKFEWLYDGFLFLDRFSKSGARFCPLPGRTDASKNDWQEVIEGYFRDDQSLGALDQLLGDLAAHGHTPIRKRQVVIMLPTPICGSSPNEVAVSTEWGSINGVKMDFHKGADRFKAAQWYVDEVLRQWKAKNYKHLELAGFYWLFERAWGVHHTREIGDYVNEQGYFLYWIPSWPQGRPNWQDLGFDFVYQQPNYFFHRKPTPSDRLEQACQFAERCHTTMEMEFNKDLLTKPKFLTYFDEYLQAYTRHGVWEKKPVAYYEGGSCWSDMAHSTDPEVKLRYEALGDIIARRQEKADAGFVFRQGAK